MTLIIVMFIIATLLVISEVMFPSLGLLGLLAAGAFLVAILEAFAMGDKQGYIAVGTTVALIPAAILGGFYVLKNTVLGNRLVLRGPDLSAVTGQGADKTLAHFVGRVGTAITPLSPSGTVEIEDTTFSAVSVGEFIDRDRQVKVIKVKGNRVVVTINDDQTGA